MTRDVVRQGRLSTERSGEIASFLSSMEADRKIAGQDVLVDLAHVVMLSRQGILDANSAGSLIRVLLEMQRDGVPEEAFDLSFEDIHAGIESYLVRVLGKEIGGRLHMGRSRNDEVATCIRMRLRDDLLAIAGMIAGLREVLLEVSSCHSETVMPGFTHFQHAQPTTLAHHLLAYEEMFGRDLGRLKDSYSRLNLCPLGAAAFASTTYPIDREMTASLLGFDGVSLNTMDAVASRDSLVEVMSDLSIMMVHASRLCEEIVVWSSPFVGFARLADEFCSTSSIMPQKRNPDTAEVMRAKTGLMLGELAAALVILKGLPMSYNRDLQDLTPHVWRAVDTATGCIPLLVGMVRSVVFDRERMALEAGKNFSTATDLADLLVRNEGLPFRTAHNIVGRAVSKGSLALATLDEAAREITGEVLSDRGLTEVMVAGALDVRKSVENRDIPGGPAPRAVRAAIQERRGLLQGDREWILDRNQRSEQALQRLLADARRIAA
jgi:argininosuccinate lyase